VKFVARNSQIFGRLVMKRVLSAIVRPDETKNTTKFILVDALGPDAAAKGIKIGDLVVPTSISTIVLDGGALARAFLKEEHAAFILTDMNVRKDFVVQTDNASEYVPFDSENAARSLGASERIAETEEAA